VAFGGAGPLHAVALARALQIRTVLVPPSPGVTSALGLLVTDLRHDYVRTYIMATKTMDITVLQQSYREFEKNATALLLREGVTRADIRFVREVDMRYQGQSYELRIPVRAGRLGPNLVSELNKSFFAAHQRSYGFAVTTEPTEIVNIRLSAIGSVPRPKRREIPRGRAIAKTALKEERLVYMEDARKPVPTQTYDRYHLKAGNRITGPAIIEEIDSTTVILPGCTARVDGYGNLLIQIGTEKALS
jgi:N-methylhydantoinase A